MIHTTYNGWTNRATWLVHLHITNDQGFFHDALTAARDLDVQAGMTMTDLDNHGVLVSHHTRFRLVGEGLAEWLRDSIHDVHWPAGTDDPYALLASDLVSTALAEVEWPEVAEAIIDAFLDN